MDSVCKSLRDTFPTGTTNDARVMRSNLLELDTSFRRFIFQIFEKLSPSSIRYTFCKVVIFNHPFDVQIFGYNKSVGIYQLTRKFMVKIRSLIANFTMKLGNNRPGLFSIRGTFFLLRKLSLLDSKLSLRRTKVFGVLYSLTIREDSKKLNADINTNSLIRYRLFDRFILNRKAGIPFINLFLNRTSFNLPSWLSVKFNFNSSYLGELETIIGYLKTFLRITKRVISIIRLEARVAGLFTCFNSTKEVLKCPFYSKQNILQDLRMNIVKKLYILFIGYKDFLLFYSGKTLACLFISMLPVKKTGVIQNAAIIQNPIKFLCLILCRIKSVFESLKHLFLFPIPVRRFTFRANANFCLFRYPLMIAAFTRKLGDFYFHTFKYNLKVKVCQMITFNERKTLWHLTLTQTLPKGYG